jgi:hypothetical protein
MPAGSATVASLSCGVASVLELSVCGTWRSTAKPVGESAWVVPGLRLIVGLNDRAPQPVGPVGVVVAAVMKLPGFCQESALRVVVNGGPQKVGLVRKGLTAAPVKDCPPDWQEGVQNRPRSESCLGSAGTPQKVMVTALRPLRSLTSVETVVTP